MTDQRASEAGETMPVFAIKAKDNLATTAICAYYAGCITHGLTDQAEQVEAALREIMDWRESHKSECKWPDHKHAPAGSPGSGSEPSPTPQSAVGLELPNTEDHWQRVDGNWSIITRRMPGHDGNLLFTGWEGNLRNMGHVDFLPRGGWHPAVPANELREEGERLERELADAKILSDGYLQDFLAS